MSRDFHEAIILAVRDITPAMRRLVLGGPGLAGYAVPADALAPYLKLCLPAPSGRDCLRTYSIRRHDPASGELLIDMVLHAGDAPGCRLAREARPGERVRLSRPGFMPHEPAPAYLLAGDHTALPAIAQILEVLGPGASVQAVIEVPDAAEEQPLPRRAALDLTWLHRAPGQPSRLCDTVRRLSAGLACDIFLWAGAEAGIARAIRKHARGALALRASRYHVLNYWKLGQPEGGFSYLE